MFISEKVDFGGDVFPPAGYTQMLGSHGFSIGRLQKVFCNLEMVFGSDSWSLSSILNIARVNGHKRGWS